MDHRRGPAWPTKTAPPAGKPGKPGSKGTPATAPGVTPSEPFSERFVAWIQAHRQLTSWIGVVILVAAVLFLWTWSSNRRSEEVAGRELQDRKSTRLNSSHS